jgi:aspartyl-tRNA(Asn)/glutamyl-tRNA(Gln) amidotransferase subunit B
MQEGSLRCDANVSVRKPGEPYRTRAEIKNVNSIRFVQQAIEYEARRQIDVYESGGTVLQETRLFDSAKGETRSMRTKEQAHDYRYFPDPDLLPLVLSEDYVATIAESLPELPDAKKERFISDYGLSPYDATLLAAERATADFYETVAEGRDAKQAANWVTGDFFAVMNRLGRSIDDPPVTAEGLGGLLDLIGDGTLSGRMAKEVFEVMVETGKAPAAIVEEKGLKQVTDSGAIETAVDAVLAANQAKVAEYRSGKDKLFGWFVGQVMKSTGGKANPALVNDILKKKLG